MLSHPLAERSARRAALSGPNILRKNFFRPVSFETNFAFGHAAVRHPTLHLSSLVHSEDLANFLRAALKRTSALSQSVLACSGAKARCDLGWRPKHLDPEAEIALLP
jgi:hypothetical protein